MTKLKRVKLLLACGNPLRQDDGAGLLLARQLAAGWQANGLAVRHLELQQLLPELALEIADEAVAEVWFVDSRVATDASDTAVQIRPIISGTHSPSLGHQLSPELLLLYAGALFDKRPFAARPLAWQITIPGFAFGHGETLTPACQRGVTQATAQLLSQEFAHA